MSDSTLEVQKAVVAAVKAAGAYTAIASTRFYDNPPQDPDFPYAHIESVDAGKAIETDGGDGWECFIRIDTWSRKPGRVQCNQMMTAIAGAIHDVALSLDTQNLIIGELATQNDIRDGDGVTRHGIQRFRFVTHP